MLNNSLTSEPPTRARWRATSPTLVSHSPKSLAYTPAKISLTNCAPVATARSIEVGQQFPDDPGHRDRGDRFGLGQIRQAELVADHHAVHSARLQGVEFFPSAREDGADAASAVVSGITGKGGEVQHGDDGLSDVENLVEPGGGHVVPFSVRVGRQGIGRVAAY